MGIIVVNSTAAARQQMAAGGEICPIHYWGYRHEDQDTLLCHRLNRWEITLRSRIGGLDPRVLMKTIRALKKGAIGTYCITQPDLLSAMPLLKRLFPRRKLVTWVWTRSEATDWFKFIRHADLILSLTDDALGTLRQLGLGDRSSLGLWGAPAAFYNRAAETHPTFDLMFFGLTSRDTELVQKLAATRAFSLLTTRKALTLLRIDDPANHRISVSSADTDKEMIAAIHSAHVAVVPLKAADPYPTGFTNLVEALLCGTSVVIPKESLIPKAALTLPGVHCYDAGNFESFQDAAHQALAENRRPGQRGLIRAAAAARLDGAELNRLITAVFGLPPQSFWKTPSVQATE